MRKSTGDTYRVVHSSLDGRWSEGEYVRESDLTTAGDDAKPLDVERLKRVGAIRKATAEEQEEFKVVEERREKAAAAADEAGLSGAERDAAIEAAITTGNPVGPVATGETPPAETKPAK